MGAGKMLHYGILERARAIRAERTKSTSATLIAPPWPAFFAREGLHNTRCSVS